MPLRKISLFAVSILLTIAVTACDKDNKDEIKPSTKLELGGKVACDPKATEPKSGIPKLTRLGNCGDFSGYLIEALTEKILRGNYYSGVPGREMAMDDAAVGAEGAKSSAPQDFTKTNVQEAGVDEPDFMKTDGSQIYVLSANTLSILKSWPPTELSVISKLELKDWPHAMLLHQKRLALFSSYWNETAADTGIKVLHEEVKKRPNYPGTRITLIDVTDAKAPKIERTIDVEAWFTNARLIDGRLIFVGDSTLPLPHVDLGYDDGVSVGIGIVEPDDTVRVADVAQKPSREEIRNKVLEMVANTSYEDWIPLMRDSKHDNQPELVIKSFDDLYVPTVLADTGMLVLLSLNLQEANADAAATTVFSRGGVVYATGTNLYTAYTSGFWWWGREGEAQALSTSIQKFTLSASAPAYASAGTVPGWVFNPYQMSEHDNALRVATSDFKTNHLTVLLPNEQGDLTEAGGVHGFATDEQIFSSRFDGDRGFVSTYHQVLMADPFFTFDLSDPYHPKLVGQLDMPGYTNYMHIVGSNHILGVGMFASGMGMPVTSVQVQLFDISDFAKPVTAYQTVLSTGDGRSFTEAAWDPHAFTFYEPQGLFAFPISIWNGDWTDYFNGLVAFKVDAAAGITELGRIKHAFEKSEWYATDIRRSIIMTGDSNTYLYSVSNTGILAHDFDDLTTAVGSASLPYNMPYYYGGGAVESKPPEGDTGSGGATVDPVK